MASIHLSGADVTAIASLALVVVTAIYAYLTWRMVREMRLAREVETSPYLIATLFPRGPKITILRINNAGRGLAMNVEAAISFNPANDTKTHYWKHKLMLPGTYEEFRIPGSVFDLENLAKMYTSVIVVLRWSNSFRKKQNATYEINFQEQKDGWSDTPWLIHPPEVEISLDKIRSELSEIHKYFKDQDNACITKNLVNQYNDERFWFKIRQKIIRWFKLNRE
jgi:hypothetical protein